MGIVTLVRWFAILAIGVYAAIVLLVFLQQRAMLYPGARSETVTADAPPWGQWQALQAADGTELIALHSPAAPGRPTVLLFLGNGDDIRAYSFMAEAFGGRGIGLLAPSYRGYPGSGGSPNEDGILSDALVAYDWLAARGSTVAIVGRSLGTGVAIYCASTRPATAVALMSPYDSIAAVAAGHFPWLPVRLLIRDSYRSDLRITAVLAPKMFIHGDRDEVIPIGHGRALFDLAPEPKQFSVLNGVGHNDVWSDSAVTQIVDFIDKNARAR